MNANYSLRDEIREYWSQRAENFDAQPGHEIFSEAERAAWLRLIAKHLGPGAGRKALDLACGTGVISHLLKDAGFQVTGADWSEAMLGKAREKVKKRQSGIDFFLVDAENSMLPEAGFDVLMTRHLVWTLVDPPSAFAHWHGLLKPGGKILIVDGDFVTRNWAGYMAGALTVLREKVRGLWAGKTAEPPLKQRHRDILRQVYFKDGARAADVAELLEQAGFGDITIDEDMHDIHRTQAAHLPLLSSLARRQQHRYAISAVRTLSNTQ